MARLRLQFKPPDKTLVRFTENHPGVEFSILSARPVADGLLSVAEVDASEPDAVVSALEDASEIRSFDVIQNDHAGMLVQYEIVEPEPHRVAQSVGALAEFPLTVRDGWLFAEMTSSHDRLSAFVTGLDHADVPFEIISLTQSVDIHDLVTDRQFDVVSTAVEMGYYDTPRACSVGDVASELGVSQSTAGGILHRAEERIIKEFLG